MKKTIFLFLFLALVLSGCDMADLENTNLQVGEDGDVKMDTPAGNLNVGEDGSVNINTPQGSLNVDSKGDVKANVSGAQLEVNDDKTIISSPQGSLEVDNDKVKASAPQGSVEVGAGEDGEVKVNTPEIKIDTEGDVMVDVDADMDY